MVALSASRFTGSPPLIWPVQDSTATGVCEGGCMSNTDLCQSGHQEFTRHLMPNQPLRSYSFFVDNLVLNDTNGSNIMGKHYPPSRKQNLIHCSPNTASYFGRELRRNEGEWARKAEMTKTAFLAQAKHVKRSSDLGFSEGTFDTTVWSVSRWDLHFCVRAAAHRVMLRSTRLTCTVNRNMVSAANHFTTQM